MEIEKIKNAKTKIIGKEIEYFKAIDSTHKYAKKIAFNQKNHGKIIIAEEQQSGIGKKGRSWYTGEGKNIAMTIILRPKIKLQKLEGLTIKIAECMSEAIYELYNCKLHIKYPNDLILNGKKICGILTEINTMIGNINYLLISIGFNVNEDKFSKEIQDISTSLKKEYNKEFKREDIIIKFIEKLETEIEL